MPDESTSRSELASAYAAAYERVFNARDVQETSGLSSRQLNDWDERGALPHDRDTEAGWRRFSIREIFVLMTCAELRRQFGVSVERVKYVQRFMLQDGADHLAFAIQSMAALGVGVWLLTDFETTFIMDTELEFHDLWGHQFFGGDQPAAFALLKMNPLVNQLLGCRPERLFLPAHGRGYEIMHEIRSMFGVRTPEEFEVLQLIRSGNYERVEIVTLDGAIKTIYVTAHPQPAADLNEIRREYPFQKLTVIQKDGRTISITQEIAVKSSMRGKQK